MKDKIIGIIGAMTEEVAELKAAMTDKTETDISGMEFSEGKLEGKKVVVVRSGIGKVNAAACTQILISVFSAGCIINTGVAGSLSEDLKIGDIVVSTDALQHDFDASPIGFKRGEVPFIGALSFKADEDMRKRAVKAAVKAAGGVNVFEGRVCSGDQFIADRIQKESIINNYGGMCCEMEGASIAQVCYLNKTPFVIIRAISDSADDSSDVTYAEFEHEAAKHCSLIVKDMIGAV